MRNGSDETARPEPTTAFAVARFIRCPALPVRQGSSPSQDPHPQDDEARAYEAPQASTRPRRFVFGGALGLPAVPEHPGATTDQPDAISAGLAPDPTSSMGALA